MTVLAGSPAWATAPEFIPIQGRLANELDVPLDDVTVTVRFSLHTTQVAGSELWYESQSITPRAGLFTAYLGQIRPLDLALFRDQGGVWMEVQVGTDDPMARVRLGTAPFAGFAQFCGAHTHSFADLTGAGSLPASALPPSTVVGAQTCDGTHKVSGITAEGLLKCTPDQDAPAGTVAGPQTCPGTNKVAGINAAGQLQCSPVADVTAGAGLSQTGSTLALAPSYADGSAFDSRFALPSGAVMAFDLPACPAGWTELLSARGRTIVGLPESGTLRGTAGTPLGDQENRPVGSHQHGNTPPAGTAASAGAHTHTVTDPGHTHTGTFVTDLATDPDPDPVSGGRTFYNQMQTGGVAAATTGISLASNGAHEHSVTLPAFQSDSAGGVAGTNAPYIQLLYCRKN